MYNTNIIFSFNVEETMENVVDKTHTRQDIAIANSNRFRRPNS